MLVHTGKNYILHIEEQLPNYVCIHLYQEWNSVFLSRSNEIELPYNFKASQVALVVKNLLANARDLRDVGSISGSGRSPGGGHGNPLQCSCLENPADRGVLRATVHGVSKSRTWLSDLARIILRDCNNYINSSGDIYPVRLLCFIGIKASPT